MPYKTSGTKVLVKRGGKWRVLKTHKTEAEAKRHCKALNANVKHK